MRKILSIFLIVFCISTASLFASPLIHVFGDSHSLEFSLIPNCEVHHLGPITMHRIGRDGLNFLNLTKYSITNEKVVIFAFGEIDVRCHIGKIRDKSGKSLDRLIETLVNKYIYTILLNKTLYKNITCIVYSVTPPTDAEYNIQYPRYGTLADRINISKKLNAKLADVCSRWGIAFLDVYDHYANADGSLNGSLSDGGVHINSAYYQAIYEKLCEILLKH